MDLLDTSKYYTKLKIKDPYHNLRIKKGGEWKTMFTTKCDTYECFDMRFGLTHAPAIFEWWMNSILQSNINVRYIVYLDDILIYSDNLEQDRKVVAAMMKPIQQKWRKLKATHSASFIKPTRNI